MVDVLSIEDACFAKDKNRNMCALVLYYPKDNWTSS